MPLHRSASCPAIFTCMSLTTAARDASFPQTHCKLPCERGLIFPLLLQVTCLAVHRLLLTLPCSRASDLRPAVFVGNTSAGATARSLAMTGKVGTYIAGTGRNGIAKVRC